MSSLPTPSSSSSFLGGNQPPVASSANDYKNLSVSNNNGQSAGSRKSSQSSSHYSRKRETSASIIRELQSPLTHDDDEDDDFYDYEDYEEEDDCEEEEDGEYDRDNKNNGDVEALEGHSNDVYGYVTAEDSDDDENEEDAARVGADPKTDRLHRKGKAPLAAEDYRFIERKTSLSSSEGGRNGKSNNNSGSRESIRAVELAVAQPTINGSTSSSKSFMSRAAEGFAFHDAKISSLPPRQKNPFSSPPRKMRQYFQPYRKERFIQAKEKGNYAAHMVDPDIHLPWSDIVQVVVPTFEEPSCPICLNHPMVPKFTKCGHIYCCSCILRHLSLGDKNNKHKCPICFEMISSKDLKSVRYHFTQDWTKIINSDDGLVEFKLMQRSINSTVAFPKSAIDEISASFQAINPLSIQVPEALTFCKIVIAPNGYVLQNIFSQELASLTREMEECKSSGEMDSIPFLEMALRMTQELMSDKVLGGGNNSSNASPASPFFMIDGKKTFSSESLEKFQLDRVDAKGTDYSSDEEFVFLKPDDMPGHSNVVGRSSDGGGQSVTAVSTPRSRKTSTSTMQSPAMAAAALPSNPALSFFFYQAKDGQYIYLHPLDIKVLKHEYGSYEKFPESIRAKVTEMEESTFTEEMKKRCKYLNHLPLSCDVAFCALDLRGLVSSETLSLFEPELKARTARRVNKIKKEERQARRLSQPSALTPSNCRDIRPSYQQQLYENQIRSASDSPIFSNSYPPKRVVDNNTMYSEEDFPLPNGSPVTSSAIPGVMSGFPSLESASPKTGSAGGISFAKVLATSPGTISNAGQHWPPINNNVTANTASPSAGKASFQLNTADLFSGISSQAAAATSPNSDKGSSASSAANPSNASGSKKNGKKKIVLMSSSAHRRYP